jgi:hypothetical protein
MRLMRALGPGSVSSFLKTILDVVFIALWIGVGVIGLLMLAGLLLSLNPDLIGHIALTNGGPQLITNFPAALMGLLASGVYIAGVLVIVARLRQIFGTLMAGDPFHPDNVARLRIIGAMLAGLEILRYLVWMTSAWLIPAHTHVEHMNLTAWFSVLVVLVLAEVFREGARLRREAELTI